MEKGDFTFGGLSEFRKRKTCTVERVCVFFGDVDDFNQMVQYAVNDGWIKNGDPIVIDESRRTAKNYYPAREGSKRYIQNMYRDDGKC